MARKLAKLGADALKPYLHNGNWHKPAIAAKTAARLKKQYRLEGREWPAPEEPKKETRFGFGLNKQPKGHKFEKVAAERRLQIQKNLENMPKLIAAYRESRKLKEGTLLDRLLLSLKERRNKQFRVQK